MRLLCSYTDHPHWLFVSRGLASLRDAVSNHAQYSMGQDFIAIPVSSRTLNRRPHRAGFYVRARKDDQLPAQNSELLFTSA